MKFTDYKHFMIVSMSTALLIEMDPEFTFYPNEPVEEAPYPNANLFMCGTMVQNVPKTDIYPDGKMHIAVYVDSNLPFIHPTGK